MAHILATLRNVNVTEIAKMLKDHMPLHKKQDLHLEHIWQNDEEPTEVLFLFRTTDLKKAKKFINDTHVQARKQDPNANLPKMIFLEEKD